MIKISGPYSSRPDRYSDRDRSRPLREAVGRQMRREQRDHQGQSSPGEKDTGRAVRGLPRHLLQCANGEQVASAIRQAG